MTGNDTATAPDYTTPPPDMGKIAHGTLAYMEAIAARAAAEADPRKAEDHWVHLRFWCKTLLSNVKEAEAQARERAGR